MSPLMWSALKKRQGAEAPRPSVAVEGPAHLRDC